MSDHEHTHEDGATHSQGHDDHEHDHTHADGTTHSHEHDHAEGDEHDHDHEHGEKKGFLARFFGG